MYVVVVLLASFCGANAALHTGGCLPTTAVETLDLQKLEGKWYEFSSLGAPIQHRLERCYVTTITAGSDGKSFTMANDRILKLVNNHLKTTWTVNAAGDQLSGNLILNFKLPFIGSVAVPFEILGTDYENYVIFNTCYSFASMFNSNIGFIFTRKRHYEAKELESLYQSIDETLKKNGLSRSKFSLSNQYNCDGSSNPDGSSTSTVDASASQTIESSTSSVDVEETTAASQKSGTEESSQLEEKTKTEESAKAEDSAPAEEPAKAEEPTKTEEPTKEEETAKTGESD